MAANVHARDLLLHSHELVLGELGQVGHNRLRGLDLLSAHVKQRHLTVQVML